MPEHTLNHQNAVPLEIDNQRMCISTLLAAYAYARAMGDKILAGHILALIRRAENPICCPADAAQVDESNRAEQRAMMERGWQIMVEQLDKWTAAPDDDRPFTDLAREAFNSGYSTAMNVIQPLWNERRLHEFTEAVNTTGIPS